MNVSNKREEDFASLTKLHWLSSGYLISAHPCQGSSTPHLHGQQCPSFPSHHRPSVFTRIQHAGTGSFSLSPTCSD
jgi:hypothetical protein